MDFTPTEQRMLDEEFARSQTPTLDDSPSWWAFLLLPPLVVALSVALVGLTIWDWLRKLLR